jgi:hypothetical protein
MRSQVAITLLVLALASITLQTKMIRGGCGCPRALSNAPRVSHHVFYKAHLVTKWTNAIRQ